MSQRNAGTATEVDVKIGGNVRSIRIARRLKMEALAKPLDISWQQVQKYETGETRLSVWALQQLSILLRVPETAFFAGLEDPATGQVIPEYDLKDSSENFNLDLLEPETVELLGKLAKQVAAKGSKE
ncbi:helix-turn-helix transcriptional regulator [Aureimonas sp. SK2]|uniref:helix-turn-helix domain-containing protein n=1 Tax=Aureimonas sp. SK2 TaxID=3015992 RepID=UPI002443F955|nr:helix-turn-helix transcriptional regulator [Aureimonas sp. SK2]